ncbi:MAG: hypothetical protein ACOC6Q_00325 [Patescibacteria group bacterium]
MKALNNHLRVSDLFLSLVVAALCSYSLMGFAFGEYLLFVFCWTVAYLLLYFLAPVLWLTVVLLVTKNRQKVSIISFEEVFCLQMPQNKDCLMLIPEEILRSFPFFLGWVIVFLDLIIGAFFVFIAAFVVGRAVRQSLYRTFMLVKPAVLYFLISAAALQFVIELHWSLHLK